MRACVHACVRVGCLKCRQPSLLLELAPEDLIVAKRADRTKSHRLGPNAHTNTRACTHIAQTRTSHKDACTPRPHSRRHAQRSVALAVRCVTATRADALGAEGVDLLREERLALQPRVLVALDRDGLRRQLCLQEQVRRHAHERLHTRTHNHTHSLPRHAYTHAR